MFSFTPGGAVQAQAGATPTAVVPFTGNAPLQSAYALSAANGIKVTVYGRSGVGKTVLLLTAPTPVIFSAESGLLSLRKVIEEKRIALNQPNLDYPIWVVKGIADLRQAHSWVMGSKEARQFQTFGLDSASEIAEQIVADEKRKTRDPRQAYGVLIDEVLKLYRDFRDLQGPNIVFLAKEEMIKHGITGAVRYAPMFPGQALTPQTPYLFDEVFNLFVGKDQEGKDFRALRTQPDHEYEGKDRSGRLAPVEWPDLSYIFAKIQGQVT